MAESSPSRILLRKVNFHSSGIYRCEITSSNFEIYEKYEQMTVIGKGFSYHFTNMISDLVAEFALL
jgi:hypothetical protein